MNEKGNIRGKTMAPIIQLQNKVIHVNIRFIKILKVNREKTKYRHIETTLKNKQSSSKFE